jgi:hypothetical protein
MKAPLEVQHGSLHNTLLGASRSGNNGIRSIPGLMLGMLREDGWRDMVRPLDGKRFTNETIEQWVLGPAWAGLYFKNWDQLYAILDRDHEVGQRVKAMLVERGAPANGLAQDVRPVVKNGEVGKGRPNRFDVIKPNQGGTSEAYLIARLKRDMPDLAQEVIAGRLSAHAAAVQAGIKRATWTAPQDVDALAQALERRYPGYRFVRVEG